MIRLLLIFITCVIQFVNCQLAGEHLRKEILNSSKNIKRTFKFKRPKRDVEIQDVNNTRRIGGFHRVNFTLPHCEFCFENGFFTLRDRNGKKLFITGNSDEAIFPTFSYSTSSPTWCKRIVIVQCNSRQPSQSALKNNLKFSRYDYQFIAENIMGHGNETIFDAVFMINSAYAYLHGHGYLFVELMDSTFGRDPSWKKVVALMYAAEQCPRSTILYLDPDSYIRTLGAKVDLGFESHSNFDIAMPIDCSWMSWLNSQPSHRRCLSMQQHNRIFQTNNWSTELGDSKAFLFLFLKN